MSASDRLTLIVMLLSTALASIDTAGAQSYPNQTIKIVVSSSAGGPNDIPARLVADMLAKLGKPAIVENRAGAGGAIGAREVAKARPDGYTLLLANTGTLAGYPAVAASPGYDPIKSFAPVANVWESYQLLVVNGSSPWKSLRELVDYAKANPGKLNYAHTGTGGLPHLSGEYFMLRSGAKIVGVPFRSGGEMATAVLSNAVHMTLGDVATQLPFVRDGTLRALAVTSAARTPVAPDLPTVIEAGVADFEVTTFFGVVAPAGTPDHVVRILNQTINEGLKSPEIRTKILRLGAVPSLGSPEDFATFIAAKGQQWMSIAQAAGVRTN